MDHAWAETSDIAAMWRPLTTQESAKADALIDSVERAIRRTWPNEIARIGRAPYPPDGDGINADDVKDVVVWSVLPILARDESLPFNAKAYTQNSGAESTQVTLDGSATGMLLTFLPWMVDVFAPAPSSPDSTVPVPSGGGQSSTLGWADWIFHEAGDPRPWHERYGDGRP